MKATILAMVCTMFALHAHASEPGTVTFHRDVEPLLRRQPVLLAFIQRSFDLADTGTDSRTISQAREPNSWAFLPFHFYARLKGESGPYTLLVSIDTTDEGIIPADGPKKFNVNVEPLGTPKR